MTRKSTDQRIHALPACRGLTRALTACLVLFSLLSLPSLSHADGSCKKGVGASYQTGSTIVEHGAAAAGEEVTDELKNTVPSAGPVDLNRREHLLILSYDRPLSRFALIRFHGGLGLSPQTVVYRTSGDGYYSASGGEPINIGTVDGVVSSSGRLYMFGVDVLFQTGMCDDGQRWHLVGLVGLSGGGYHGKLLGEFDARITSRRPDEVMRGRYSGAGMHTNLMVGLRFDISEKLDAMLLGGLRLGVGYISFESDLKDRDGAMPIAGAVVQLGIRRRF